MFESICPCGVEGFAWLDKQEIFVLSDSACIYEHAGHRVQRTSWATYQAHHQHNLKVVALSSMSEFVPKTPTL